VAISNARLLSMDDHTVVFRTRGADTAALPPTEFIGRFLQHILPSRFVKIRHFGLTASGNVNTKLQCARTLLPAVSVDSSSAVADGHDDAEDSPSAGTVNSDLSWPALLLALTGQDVQLCPRCQQRTIVRLCANCCRQLVPRRKQRETHEPLGQRDRLRLRAAMAIALPAAVRACCRRWWLHDLRLVGDDNQVSCPRKNRRDSPSQEPKPDNDPIAAKLPRKRFIHPAFTGMRAPEPARQPRRLLRSTPANGYSLRILKPGSAPACLTATR
jgi:hypothetical protein